MTSALEIWLRSVADQSVVSTAIRSYDFKLEDVEALRPLLDIVVAHDEALGRLPSPMILTRLISVLPRIIADDRAHPRWAIPGEEWQEHDDAPWQERLVARLVHRGVLVGAPALNLVKELSMAGMTGVLEQVVRMDMVDAVNKKFGDYYRGQYPSCIEAAAAHDALRLVDMMLSAGAKPRGALKEAISPEMVKLLVGHGATEKDLPIEWKKRIGVQRAKELIVALDAATNASPEDVLFNALNQGTATLISSAAKQVPLGMRTRFEKNGWSWSPALIITLRTDLLTNREAMIARAHKALPPGEVLPGVSDTNLIAMAELARARWNAEEVLKRTPPLADPEAVLREAALVEKAPASRLKSAWIDSFALFITQGHINLAYPASAQMQDRGQKALASLCRSMWPHPKKMNLHAYYWTDQDLSPLLKSKTIDPEDVLWIASAVLREMSFEKNPKLSRVDGFANGLTMALAMMAGGPGPTDARLVDMMQDRMWELLPDIGPQIRSYTQQKALENAIQVPTSSTGPARPRM